jgi:hypothetical protein
MVALLRICALTAWAIKQPMLCLKCGTVMPTVTVRSMQLTKPSIALLRQYTHNNGWIIIWDITCLMAKLAYGIIIIIILAWRQRKARGHHIQTVLSMETLWRRRS